MSGNKKLKEKQREGQKSDLKTNLTVVLKSGSNKLEAEQRKPQKSYLDTK